MRSDEGGLLLDKESILSGAALVAAHACEHTNRAERLPCSGTRGSTPSDMRDSTAINGIGGRQQAAKMRSNLRARYARQEQSRFASD